MVIARNRHDGVLVLRPAGPVVVDDANAGAFETAMLEHLDSESVVVLDASSVDFFACEGVDSLLRFEDEISARRGSLVLTGLNAAVAEFFRINGLDCLFRIYPDLPEAIRGVRSPSSRPRSWH